MAVSDAIYGPTQRYVSRQRLAAMLEHEWGLLRERLDASRGEATRFFVFADTVTATSYSRREAGRGWLGIRFQSEKRSPPSQLIIHARMWDPDNLRQQEALGILGVNLIHGAFYQNADPAALIGSLMDNLSRDRMEVDMIKFSGPAFAGVDSRLMSLQLVEQRLTNAVLFSPDGEVVEPAELLHRRPVLLERGSFRPLTRLTLDMLERSLDFMRASPQMKGREPVVLLEMTLRHLLRMGEKVEHEDFLARVETLRALGKTVMVSNYSRFHTVIGYLRRYTPEWIVLALGIPTLVQLFEEEHYSDLEGGVLEALGRLLSGPVTLCVYPWKNPQTGELVDAAGFRLPDRLRHLYEHLLDNHLVVPIRSRREEDLKILPADVLLRLQAGDATWENLVPEPVVSVIKQGKLFGYRGPPAVDSGGPTQRS
jgi:hypothetical protein